MAEAEFTGWQGETLQLLRPRRGHYVIQGNDGGRLRSYRRLSKAWRVAVNMDRLRSNPELVLQRAATDCGICALAMATGLDYRLVVRRVLEEPELYKPLEGGLQDMPLALTLFGYKWEGEPDDDITNMDRGWLSGEYVRQWAWGRRAIMMVPCLNEGIHVGYDSQIWHYIYWDGSRIMDPSPQRHYRQLEDVSPQTITLFREV